MKVGIGMLRIKEFSVLSQIGVRMLRHYDNIGLLHPAHIDENNNYRYYDEEQLLIANTIQTLKSIGVNLKEIKSLLNNCDNSVYMSAYLNEPLIKRQKELKDMEDNITHISSVLQSINNNSIYSFKINLKEIPQHNVVSLRKKVHSYQEEAELFQTMFHEISEQGIKLQSPPYNKTIYHDKEFKHTNIDIEIQCNVIGQYSDFHDITFKTIPSKKIISIVMQGDFDFMNGLNLAVANWLRDNHYIFSGPMYNVYHRPPNRNVSCENWLIEVCFPVEKK